MIRVYVAGPITKGNVMHNIHAAIKAGDQLMRLGFCPFVPHATCFWDIISPHTYEEWMAYDEEWLKVCDALLRIPGESTGAEKEILVALDLDIPVFHNVADLVEWAAKQ